MQIALRIEIVTAVIALAAGVLATLALTHAGPWLAEEFEDAAVELHYFWWRLVTTVLLVGFGVSLYAFRRWNRTVFGIGELGLGVFVVWNILGQLSGGANTAVWLTVLTGSTFVIIRGCDNIQQGIDGRREHRVEAGSSI